MIQLVIELTEEPNLTCDADLAISQVKYLKDNSLANIRFKTNCLVSANTLFKTAILYNIETSLDLGDNQIIYDLKDIEKILLYGLTI